MQKMFMAKETVDNKMVCNLRHKNNAPKFIVSEYKSTIRNYGPQAVFRLTGKNRKSLMIPSPCKCPVIFLCKTSSSVSHCVVM